MSMTLSTRVETRTRSGSSGQQKHDLRLGMQPAYIDGQRSHLNTAPAAYKSAQELSELCLERRRVNAEHKGAKRRPARMRKDAIVSVAGIITFGKEAQRIIRGLPPQEQDSFFLVSAKAIAKHLNTTLEGLTIHRDESAPHAHYQLAGYDLEGAPLSKKLTKGMCSELQDIAATPFLDLGITRGEKIAARIDRGEHYSKTIHRSVRQLHSDLPKEIEVARKHAARQQALAEKTAKKLDLIKEKLAQAKNAGKAELAQLEKNKAKLEKRLSTYGKRVEDRKSELIRLSQIAKETPDPQQAIVATIEPKKGLFRKDKIKSLESLTYLPYEGIKFWYGAMVEQRQEAIEQANKAIRQTQEIKQELATYRTAIKSLTMNTARPSLTTPSSSFAATASEAHYELHYGVIIQRTPSLVRVPPQKAVTNKQIAAALYRGSRDNFPEGSIVFRVSNDEVAKEIIKMAILDGVTMRICFDEKRLQDLLIDTAIEQERRYGESRNPPPPRRPSRRPRPSQTKDFGMH